MYTQFGLVFHFFHSYSGATRHFTLLQNYISLLIETHLLYLLYKVISLSQCYTWQSLIHIYWINMLLSFQREKYVFLTKVTLFHKEIYKVDNFQLLYTSILQQISRTHGYIPDNFLQPYVDVTEEPPESGAALSSLALVTLLRKNSEQWKKAVLKQI